MTTDDQNLSQEELDKLLNASFDTPNESQKNASSSKQETSSKSNAENESSKMHNTWDLEAVYDVPVQISAVLGKSTMPVHQLLKLGRGAVVELDRRVGEAIDIYVNNRLVARGEVVVVDDHLGVTMTEIIKSERGI